MGLLLLYGNSLSSTLLSSQNGVNLNLWFEPEVFDATRDFIAGRF
jgi:hypothetical protein